MAFNSFIRRVSSLEIGSVVGRVISPLTNVQKHHLVGRQFLPFSTTRDLADKLFGLVESAKCTQQSSNVSSPYLLPIPTMNFPDEFPFGIEENDHSIIGEFRKYLLRRKYQDEIIVVALDGYEVLRGTPQIPLNAHVLRGSQHLQFEMMAKPDRIDIQTCTIKDTVTGHVNAFNNYLDIRGFNSSTINSLVHFQQSSNVPVIGFPFEIVDKHEKGVLFFRRRFECETINTEVSGLSACVSNIENPEREFQMSVTVFRTQTESNFKISVFPHRPDPILLHEVCTRTRDVHLDAFQEFWEIRGIKPSITNFLFDHFNKKAQQNYRRWTGVKFS